MNLQMLISGIDTGICKWRYTNTAYSEQEIQRLIRNNELVLDHCWCIAEDSVFNKLRCGIVREKTPPPPSKQSKPGKSRQRHTSR